MSCSFTNQVLAQMKLHAEAADMELGVEVLSKELDEEVARLHLDALGVRLTEMTQDQADYLGVPKTDRTSQSTTATERSPAAG